METLVILLSIAVIMLSVVVIALLAAITLVVVKVNRIAKNVDAETHNAAHASEWLVPAKVFAAAVKALRR